MKYPSLYIASGTIEEVSRFFTFLRTICIDPHIRQERFLYLDGRRQECIYCSVKPIDVPVVSIEEATTILQNFYESFIDWVNSLQIGDIVTIEKPRGPAGYYPCGFGTFMQRLEGQSFEIERINISPHYYNHYKFNNNTHQTFILKGDSDHYIWHSSMFEMTPIKVKKIELTPIDLI